MKPVFRLILAFACPCVASAGADTVFFEAKIRPVLVKHCYECHSAESGKSKGGLMLDTKHGIREGGETGPAVVPGDVAKSLLLTAIKHSDPDLEMPPKEPQLPKAVIADFETWIKAGAADPRESAVKAAERPPVDVAAGKQFWSYKPPVMPKQASGGIDGFIREKLTQAGLKPAQPAERVVLLRRLSFDLTGLPPSDVSDKSDSSDYEQQVDELLQSPRFGERWGRHWLDVVRYAESNGRESNLTFPHAWRYRDYVIDAVNTDVPHDRFITEQIAGDLLPAKDDAERARLLTATGFLAMGPKGLNEQNKSQFAADVADEQLDTVTRVKQLKTDLAKLNADEMEQNKYIAKAKIEKRDISGEFNKLLGNALRILWTRGGVEGALEAVDDKGRALPLCMGVKDAKRITDSALYERGEIAHPGKTVPRGFPRVMDLKISMPKEQSGRLELAKWLISRENPLTARVIVNRVWRHLFGAGLVRTVDNFGFSGERPSHPELLDYLAIKFMDGGWSVKKLIKEIVMSETYRRTSFPTRSETELENSVYVDPDNRLLSHTNKRRLDAEVIRDSMLAVSGLLDTTRHPGSLVAELDGQSVSLIGFNTKLPPDLDGSHHRSIYLPVIRDHLPDVLEQFDVANPNLVTGDRDVTNVPLQGLYLLNGSFVQEMAAALAKRIQSAPNQIELAFQLCFNRTPDAQEIALAEKFLRTKSTDESKLLAAFCQSLLASAEFRFAD
jgi:hypothetical protein